MSTYRIYALILRHIYHFRHNYDKFTEIFVFPVIDVLLWGMTSKFFAESLSKDSGNSGTYIIVGIVSGYIFSIVLYRIGSDIPFGLLDEVWTRNLINIFGSPLSLAEWVTSSVLVGFLKALAAAIVTALISFFLYQVNILHFGFYLIPFVFLLVLAGTWIGLMIAAIIMRFGLRVQALTWSLPVMLLPFSAIYYPVSILPGWAQTIAHVFPMTYMFEAARQVFAGGVMNWNYLWIAFALNCVYLILFSLYFIHAFKVRLEKGIMRLQL